MPTNLDLAPPPITVDGLLAVPIDIRHVQASLVFDGAASSGVGDAMVQFESGIRDGGPIFDLRQTLTGVWLDGASLTPSKAAHHNFGGGPNAELRVVELVVPAGTPHTLRVAYSLGSPQASGAGSYLPAMTWSPGAPACLQLRVHGPRRRPVPGGLVASEPDLRTSSRWTSTSGCSTRASRTRSSPTERSRMPGSLCPSSSTGPSPITDFRSASSSCAPQDARAGGVACSSIRGGLRAGGFAARACVPHGTVADALTADATS